MVLAAQRAENWTPTNRRVAIGRLVGLGAVASALAILAVVAFRGPQAAGPDGSRGGGSVPTVIVDGDSLGGECNDHRSAGEARSSATPICSLQRALEEAPPGSLVRVRKGSYPRFTLKDQQREETVTVRPYESDKVVLAGFDTLNSAGYRFEGFRITDLVLFSFDSKRMQLVGNDVSPKGIAARARSSDILIERNYIHDISRDPTCNAGAPDGYGIWITGGLERVDRVVIKRNRITRVPIDGIQLGAVFGMRMEGNEFSDIRPVCLRTPERDQDHSDPIQILGGENFFIASNFIRDSDSGLMLHPGGGAGVIQNNVIVRIAGWASQVGTRPRLRIMNNTWWGNGYGGLLVRDDPTDDIEFGRTVVANNVIDKLGTVGNVPFTVADYNLIKIGIAEGTHNLRGMPTFARPARYDYRLKATSLGVDAGTSNEAPRLDRLGKKRYDHPLRRNRGGGKRPYVDIGAHEVAAPRRRR